MFFYLFINLRFFSTTLYQGVYENVMNHMDVLTWITLIHNEVVKLDEQAGTKGRVDYYRG